MRSPRIAIVGLIVAIAGLVGQLAVLMAVAAWAGGMFAWPVVYFAVGPAGFVLSALGWSQARRDGLPTRLAFEGVIIGGVTVAMAITFPLLILVLAILFDIPS